MLFSKQKKVFIHTSSSEVFLVLGQEIDKRFIVEELTHFNSTGEEFKAFTQKEKLKRREVQVVLGGEELFSRIILIPEVPEKEIKKILAWELRKHLSIGWEEEIIFDYQPLGPMEMTQAKLQGHLVIGGRRNHIQSSVEFLTHLGLTIKNIDVEAMVLKHVYKGLEGIKTPQDSCLYLADDRAVLNFFQNKKLIYTTSFKLNKSLEILQQRFYQGLEYLKRYFLEMDFKQLIFLGVGQDGFSQKDLESALNIKTIYIDIKDIYGHLTDIDLDNSYLMSMGMAFKEVNKK